MAQLFEPLLAFGIVMIVRRSHRVAQKQVGSCIGRIGVKDAVVAAARAIVLFVVFIQQAEVQQDADVRREDGGGALVQLQRSVVVAAPISGPAIGSRGLWPRRVESSRDRGEARAMSATCANT